MQKEYGVKAYAYPMDLALPGAAGKISSWALEKGLVISLLVNNAGFSVRGNFCAIDNKNVDTILKLNVISATELTREVLPQMVAKGYGRILFVSSITGISAQV